MWHQLPKIFYTFCSWVFLDGCVNSRNSGKKARKTATGKLNKDKSVSKHRIKAHTKNCDILTPALWPLQLLFVVVFEATLVSLYYISDFQTMSWNKDFSSPSCTSNSFILVWILFQTFLWLWEPNKVIHWVRHWSSGPRRGKEGGAKIRKGGSENALPQGPGTARKVICFVTCCSLGFLEERGELKRNKHTHSEMPSAIFPNGQFPSVAAFHSSSCLTSCQSQTWGLNPISFLYKLCELGQLT